MSNLIIIGSQWGDEGKGKIVDLLTEQASTIVRFQGGSNAGHTVMFGDATYILHLIPSGILHKEKTCIIGNGVVVDPIALLDEIKELERLGISCTSNLKISDSANLILPYHKIIDQVREENKKAKKIGTTGRGIGPAYEDKVCRTGIRFIDISDTSEFKHTLSEIIEEKNLILKYILQYSKPFLDINQIYDDLMIQYHQLKPFLIDCSEVIFQTIQRGENILFEGAQGTFLDIDHGTYPYVTSSNTTSGGACTGSGVAPNQIDHVLGVVKAYTTRVGKGPFPTELQDNIGKKIQQQGKEFGATTGRTRRCGWFDACLVRESVRINGLTSLAITKLDVLDQLEMIQVCVAYQDKQGNQYTSLPHCQSLQKQITPIYEELEGWNSSTYGITQYESLPQNAKNYLGYLEEKLQVPIAMISTGPKREQTICLKKVF